MAAGGTFDISGTTSGATITRLSGDASGSVVLGARVLTLSNASTTFDGVIGGSGGELQIFGAAETPTGAIARAGANQESRLWVCQ